MTTILPGNARTPWDVIGTAIGRNLENNLPGAVQQGFQRQMGLNALDQAQQEIGQAGGDPFKIAMAFARAGAQNPSLERVLGPLYQTAINRSRAQDVYGRKEQSIPQTQPSGATPQQITGNVPQQGPSSNVPKNVNYPSNLVTPSITPNTKAAYSNVLNPDEEIGEAERRTLALGDPSTYSKNLADVHAENQLKLDQRNNLGNLALSTGEVSPNELPEFLELGATENTSNPDQWLINTGRKWREYKDYRDKLYGTYVPGFAFGHFGGDRQKALKRLQPTIKEMVLNGMEKQARKFLDDQWLTPTEVEEQVHPLSSNTEKYFSNVPKGIFPASIKKTYKDVLDVFKGKSIEKSPFVDYETALEKDPRAMEIMQNRLSDFFLKNVDSNVSLSVLRDKLWRDKDYDWRQIGPAIRQAESMGLKLSPDQKKELAYIESQPPIQSLPDIFKDWWRPFQLLKGGK